MVLRASQGAWGLNLWKKVSANEKKGGHGGGRLLVLTFVGASVLQRGPKGLCQAGITP